MTRPKNVKILLYVGLGLCLLTGIIILSSYRQKERAQYWVDHTNEVIEEAGIAMSAYKDVEAVYLEIGDGDQMQADSLIEIFLETIRRVQTLTIDNPVQIKLIDEDLMPAVNKRLVLLKGLKSTNGKRVSYSQEIPGLLKLLVHRERYLLSKRTDELSRVTVFMVVVVILSLALIIAIILLAFVSLTKIDSKNQQLVTTLKNVNKILEEKVSEQTKELRGTNEDLQKRNEDLAALNEELGASEEELRSSLEYISALKTDLETREKLYKLLADHSQGMITIVNLDSVIEYVSPACKTILYYNPEELIGKRGSDLVYVGDSEAVQIRTQNASIKGGKVSNFQFRMVRKDGSLVWVELESSPVLDADGNVIKRQSTVHDVTLRKQAEEQLVIAKEKAEEATKAKSQFLSTMSHEIRTPMNAVIGLSNILLQNDPRPDQSESLRLLKFSSENLLSIINDILDFSKIEASKVVLEKVNFNLVELVSNSKAFQQKRASDKGINLRLKLDKNIPAFVGGDPVRLNQVLTNLISNAIKFTEKGFVEINVSRQSVREKLHTLEFKVIDSGIGIAADKLDHVFESFSQASSDTTRRFGGTGLGLAISTRLVEMMGGDLRVESILEKGSTFSFEIRLEDGYDDSGIKSTLRKGIELKNHHSRVLLVEDNRVNQIVANNFLKHWNIKVDYANNGIEALSLIKNKTYHLVLMDLQMPEMDGYTAASEIRAMEDRYFQKIPIIALTASAMTEIQEKALGVGMNDYLSKPFDPETLKGKVFHYLNMSMDHEEVDKPWTEAINFYSKGNPQLKWEMADLFIKNIMELQNAVTFSRKEKDGIDKFKAVTHKAKTAMNYLGDKEFDESIEKLSNSILTNDDDFVENYKRFMHLSERLIEGLREDLKF